MLDDVGFGNSIDGAMIEAHAADGSIRETLHEKRVLRFARSQSAHFDVAHHRTFGTLVPRIVIKIDLQHGIRNLADFDVTDIDVLNRAATHGVGLETQGLVQIGAGEPAVFNEYVPYTP